MGTTVKALVLKQCKRKDKTYNLKIRVIHNCVVRYINTPWYVDERYVTKSMVIRDYRLLDKADEVVIEYRRKLEDLGMKLKKMSADKVVDYLLDREPEEYNVYFFSYAQERIEYLIEAGRIGNARTYKVAVNSLRKFHGKNVLPFKSITVSFLRDWMKWITKQPRSGNRERGGRAEGQYMSTIRAIFNHAKRELNDEDSGIVPIPHYPFVKIDIPKPLPTKKRAVTKEKLLKIISYPDQPEVQWSLTNRINLARDVYAMSFMLIGMNAVDLYNVKDYDGERITYERTKTRNRRQDRAEISIKVEPEARDLIEKYRDKSGERVFDFYQRYQSVDAFTRALNIGLTKICESLGTERVQFYSARHTLE